MNDDEAMMLALEEARAALSHGDVPVGAIVVNRGNVVGRAHNERELRQDSTAHAEVLAIRQACEALGTWRLNEATLFVSLEPCVMCAGAIVAARLARVVFAATDPKAGATGSLYNVCADPRLNHEVEVTSGHMETESAQMIRQFFASKRKPPTEL